MNTARYEGGMSVRSPSPQIIDRGRRSLETIQILQVSPANQLGTQLID